MTSLIFYNQPGKNVSLYASSSSIQKYYKNFGSKFSSFEKGNDNTYKMQIDLEIRNCTNGEIFRKNLLMLIYVPNLIILLILDVKNARWANTH